jgi:hypothetical protein
MRAEREIAMAVAKWQTWEDGAPRTQPRVTEHFAGTENEYLRFEMAVRQRSVEPLCLVIRHWTHKPLTTMALESIRVE